MFYLKYTNSSVQEHVHNGQTMKFLGHEIKLFYSNISENSDLGIGLSTELPEIFPVVAGGGHDGFMLDRRFNWNGCIHFFGFPNLSLNLL